MGNCYSLDHTAEDHIHTDITCNTGETQQKHRLRSVGIRLLVMDYKFSMGLSEFQSLEAYFTK